MSFLIETKSPWAGWEPFKVMHMPINMLLDFIHDHFHSEMHVVRFKRLNRDQIESASSAVIELWGQQSWK